MSECFFFDALQEPQVLAPGLSSWQLQDVVPDAQNKSHFPDLSAVKNLESGAGQHRAVRKQVVKKKITASKAPGAEGWEMVPRGSGDQIAEDQH